VCSPRKRAGEVGVPGPYVPAPQQVAGERLDLDDADADQRLRVPSHPRERERARHPRRRARPRPSPRRARAARAAARWDLSSRLYRSPSEAKARRTRQTTAVRARSRDSVRSPATTPTIASTMSVQNCQSNPELFARLPTMTSVIRSPIRNPTIPPASPPRITIGSPEGTPGAAHIAIRPGGRASIVTGTGTTHHPGRTRRKARASPREKREQA
jgi:hypothetical protein